MMVDSSAATVKAVSPVIEHFDAFTVVAFVRNKDVREFVMYPLAVVTTEPAYDENDAVSDTSICTSRPLGCR
jgi:hypothetical protein